ERSMSGRDKDIERLLQEGYRLMTPRQRMSHRIRMAWWSVKAYSNFWARRFIPGYKAVWLAWWRVRDQGLSGIWTPPFNIDKQDPTIYDKRMRWHGWGVLR